MWLRYYVVLFLPLIQLASCTETTTQQIRASSEPLRTSSDEELITTPNPQNGPQRTDLGFGPYKRLRIIKRNITKEFDIKKVEPKHDKIIADSKTFFVTNPAPKENALKKEPNFVYTSDEKENTLPLPLPFDIQKDSLNRSPEVRTLDEKNLARLAKFESFRRKNKGIDEHKVFVPTIKEDWSPKSPRYDQRQELTRRQGFSQEPSSKETLNDLVSDHVPLQKPPSTLSKDYEQIFMQKIGEITDALSKQDLPTLFHDGPVIFGLFQAAIKHNGLKLGNNDKLEGKTNDLKATSRIYYINDNTKNINERKLNVDVPFFNGNKIEAGTKESEVDPSGKMHKYPSKGYDFKKNIENDEIKAYSEPIGTKLKVENWVGMNQENMVDKSTITTETPYLKSNDIKPSPLLNTDSPDSWIGYNVPKYTLPYQRTVFNGETMERKPKLYPYPNDITLPPYMMEQPQWITNFQPMPTPFMNPNLEIKPTFQNFGSNEVGVGVVKVNWGHGPNEVKMRRNDRLPPGTIYGSPMLYVNKRDLDHEEDEEGGEENVEIVKVELNNTKNGSSNVLLNNTRSNPIDKTTFVNHKLTSKAEEVSAKMIERFGHKNKTGEHFEFKVRQTIQVEAPMKPSIQYTVANRWNRNHNVRIPRNPNSTKTEVYQKSRNPYYRNSNMGLYLARRVFDNTGRSEIEIIQPFPSLHIPEIIGLKPPQEPYVPLQRRSENRPYFISEKPRAFQKENYIDFDPYIINMRREGYTRKPEVAPSQEAAITPTQQPPLDQTLIKPTAPKPIHLEPLSELHRTNRPKNTLPLNFKPVSEIDSEITKLGYHFDDMDYINDQPVPEIPYGPPKPPKKISTLDQSRVRNNFDKIYGIESLPTKFGARNATGFKLRNNVPEKLNDYKENMRFRNHRYPGENQVYDATNEYQFSQTEFMPKVFPIQSDIRVDKDYGFLNHYLFPKPVPSVGRTTGTKHVIHQINQLDANRRNLVPLPPNVENFLPGFRNNKPPEEHNGYRDFSDAFNLREKYLKRHKPLLHTQAIQRKFDQSKDDNLKVTHSLNKLDIYYFQ